MKCLIMTHFSSPSTTTARILPLKKTQKGLCSWRTGMFIQDGVFFFPPFCCLFCPLESIWQNIFAHATWRQTFRQVRPSAYDKRDARYKNNISVRVKFVFFFLWWCISRGLQLIESAENKQRWDRKYKMRGQTRKNKRG